MKKKGKAKANGHAFTADLRELPPGWLWVRLEDLASPEPRSITDGPFGSNLKSEHYTETGPRVIRLENIGHGQFIDKAAHISQAHYRRLERHAVTGGDLVIAILGSPLPRACIVPGSLGAAIVKADCIRFKPDAALVDNRFACWWINSKEPQKAAEDAVHGVGRPRLGMQNVKDLMVPLAPRPEQDRIVAKLDELFSDIDAGEKSLERAILLAKRYRQSVLKAAVTGELTKDWRAKNLARLKREKRTGADLLAQIMKRRREAWEAAELAKLVAKGKPPKDDKWKQRYVEPPAPEVKDLPELPDGWAWARLDAISDLTGGVTVDKKRKPRRPVTLPYLRVANVQRGYISLVEIKEITVEEVDAKALLLEDGDILFTEGGDRDKLGRGWVWREQLPACIHQNHIFRARLFGAKYLSELISHYGNVVGPRYFSDEGKQTTNLASVGLSKLRAFPVPVPPAEEAAHVQALLDEGLTIADQQAKDLERGRAASNSLRIALLQAAFSGQLASQDPNDEPASLLIDRIHAERNASRLPPPNGAAETTKPGPHRGRRRKASESDDAQGKLL